MAILIAVLSGIVLFETLDIPVFARIGLPHEVCFIQQPKLIWLHVTSDLLIGISYVSISLTLGYLVYKASKDIPFNWVLLAFGLFIVSCGFTHFMEVWVVWNPVYWLSGYVKVVTAAASVATAIALFPLMPKIFDLIASAREGDAHRREIERLNEDLERFNYSVAHDLRAPLRSIVGFSQILQEDYARELSSEAASYVRRMQGSAEKMDALVTGLLRYATIGRQAVALVPVSLEDAARGALLLLEREIRERSAVVDIPERLPKVHGDPTLLQLVFQNLIGNSIKFVAHGAAPHVVIAAHSEGPSVVVSVTDNGIGFPPESRPKVFGMFERFHPEHPGTGIGLAIVQRAVHRMQGDIWVEPGPHGAGSRFNVRLRLS
jgi:signal transduction histidine kinase